MRLASLLLAGAVCALPVMASAQQYYDYAPSFQVGTPTGGAPAAGGINAQSISVNGVPVAAPGVATTAAIGGASVPAGACTTGTVPVAGSTTAMSVDTSPATFPGAGFFWQGYVSAAGTVTVEVCNATAAALTPVASAYNVRVLQ